MDLISKLPTDIKINLEQYMFHKPFRLTYLKCGKCYICGEENTHVNLDYIDLQSLIGFQYCEKCKNEKESSKEIYMIQNKMISLEEFNGAGYNETFKIRRSNGKIEDWNISFFSPVYYDNFFKDWVVPMRSSYLFKNVKLSELKLLNRNSNLLKIITEKTKRF